MAAVAALHAGEAIVQISTIEIPVNDLREIGSPESVFPFEPFLIDIEKGFKIIIHAPVIIGRLRIPWTINSGGSGHDHELDDIRYLFSSGGMIRTRCIPLTEFIK
jgi:hypothetical protein